MVQVYRPNYDEEDRKKVLDYTKYLNQNGKKPMAVTVYAPEEDVKKWQDKADECGWPLQLYILSVMNGYCKYLEEGAEEGNDFDGIGAYVPFT
jgi:hypothetical protein